MTVLWRAVGRRKGIDGDWHGRWRKRIGAAEQAHNWLHYGRVDEAWIEWFETGARPVEMPTSTGREELS